MERTMKNHRIPYLIFSSLTLLALIFATLPQPSVKAQGSSLTFTPAADAFVNSSAASQNYGTSTSLRIDGSPTMHSYLRFEVKGLNGAAVQSAKLQIYANSSNDSGLTVKTVGDNSWAEKSIKYSGAPGIGSAIKSVGKFSEGKTVEVDVSSYIHGEGTFSLALVARNNTQTNLASREDSHHAPKLVLTLGSGQPPAPTQPAPTQPAAQPTATQPPAASPTGKPTQPPAPSNTPAATQPPAPPNTPAATQPPAQPTATLPPVPQPTNTLAPTQPAAQPTATQPAPVPTQSASCSAVVLTKGPTLIFTGNNTQMRVFWQWTANSAFTVQWGSGTSYGSSASVSAQDTTNHLYQYDISGLTPGSKYYYRVVTGAQCASGSFNTAPAASSTSIKFFAYGDTRTNGSTHNSVAGQVDAAFAADPALQSLNINVGDWVSGDSESAWTSEYFNTAYTNVRKQDANIADIGVRGNHESGATYWKRYWPEPFQSGGLYWSFDYGPMHVVMLDQYTSYTPGSAQYNWLKADLAASTKTWKFVVYHEPGWSASGGHANNTTVQQDLQPLFVQYGVSVVFNGHNHYYARASVSGVTHLTLGGGGAPSYTPASGQPDIVKTYKGNSFGEFSISGNTLTGTIIGSSGSVVDTFTVTR
jgi:hypothetical protein